MADRTINVGVIGTGWIGEIRARVCAAHPLVESLRLAEIDPEKLERVARETGAQTATSDYRELLRRPDVDAIFVCTTPETTHYPIAKDCLLARKHTFLEKPMGLALKEGDKLEVRRSPNRVFLIRNPKMDYFAILRQKLHWGER